MLQVVSTKKDTELELAIPAERFSGTVCAVRTPHVVSGKHSFSSFFPCSACRNGYTVNEEFDYRCS